MSKVLFVAKVVRSHIATFHLPYLKMFKEMGWETAVAAHNDYENPEDCVIPNCDTYFDVPFERFPLSPHNVESYRQLKKIIDAGNYDIIHCHTPVSAMITRLAALGARKRGTKVIYTAHGFHFFKGAPLINWLLYYPVERILSHWTDVLITINKEDYERAQTFKAKKVYFVPGVGIDTKKFTPNPEIRIRKRQEMGFKDDEIVLLSVGEVNENKNHKVVIEALSKLGRKDVKYVICGTGPLMESHRQLAESLGVADRLILAGFRRDVAEFYQAADIFVFPSLREGLPVAIMEAMGSEIPVACTAIRGNADLIENNRTGYHIRNDAQNIADTIQHIIDYKKESQDFVVAAKRKLMQYDLDNVVENVREIYNGIQDQ